MNEIIETLSAAKTSKKDGKGNRYVELMRGHVPLIALTHPQISANINHVENFIVSDTGVVQW